MCLSVILIRASRGALPTACAVARTKRESGLRLYATDGSAERAAAMPSAAGGAAWPACSARSAVRGPEAEAEVLRVQREAALAGGDDDDVAGKDRAERLLEPGLGLGDA